MRHNKNGRWPRLGTYKECMCVCVCGGGGGGGGEERERGRKKGWEKEKKGESKVGERERGGEKIECSKCIIFSVATTHALRNTGSNREREGEKSDQNVESNINLWQ